MKKYTQNLIRIGAMLLIAFGIVGPAGLAAVAPVQAATFFPGAVCESGTCDVYAKTGTVTMPDGAVIPIWGFAPDAGSPAALPGPTLVGTVGQTLQVVLHNGLSQNLSLDFPGFAMVPDLTGAAAGGTVTYNLSLDKPGTFLYQAGMTANGPRQVAMGLYGAIVVRPAGQPLQAYDDPATTFADEALLVFSEIDPAFNANPSTFLLENFNPRYWLINGKSFPQTDQYTVDADRTVLFRYINAGVDHHSIGLLGLRQMLLAKDSTPLRLPYTVNTEIMGAGQTMDVLVHVPASAVSGSKFLLYETSLIQHNANQRLVPGGPVAVGGMMTTITVGASTATSPLIGPLVTSARVSPSPTTGSQGVVLSVTLAAGGIGMEYFIDVLGPPGTGIGAAPYQIFLPLALRSGPSATGPAPEPPTSGAFSFFIPADVLATLSGGNHTFYVRGRDASGSWGPVASAVLNLDKVGPAATTLKLTTSPANGQLDVELTATGDDLHNGNAVVTGATFAIDGGAPQPMLLAQPDRPIVALSATIPAAAIAALDEGTHSVAIRVTDGMGNTGDPATIPLVVDKTGPVPGAITLNPADFVAAAPPTIASLNMRLSITDQGVVPSNLVAVKGFIRGTGTAGFDMFTVDGFLDETSEEVWFDISVANFANWGVYTLAVQAQDAAGNWGPYSSVRILPAGPVVDTFIPLAVR